MSSETFYEGGGYALKSDYGLGMGLNSSFGGYRVNSYFMGFPSDPGTANQLKAVGDKLNTGAKVVEVSTVNIGRVPGGHMGIIEAIPKQHFKEIRRLKELVGAELTLHGPLIELSGTDARGGKFEETDRQRAEREAWSVLQKARILGENIPVVFHSTALGLAEYEQKVKDEKTGEEKIIGGLMVDGQTGQLMRLPEEKEDFFTGQKIQDPKERVKRLNMKEWDSKLQRVNFAAEQGVNSIERTFQKLEKGIEEKEGKFGRIDKEEKQQYLESLKKYIQEPKKFQSEIGDLEKDIPGTGKNLEEVSKELLYGEIYIREAYNDMKALFNEAYEIEKENKNSENFKQLEEFKKTVSNKVLEIQEDPSRVEELGKILQEGVRVLRRIGAPNKNVLTLSEHLIDKSSETISNLTMRSFKSFGEDAPVIAIENPPAGTFPLSRAEELKELIEVSRNKFVEKATSSEKNGGLGLSKKEAQKQAEKLIGITWDTAHINDLQGLGYSEADVVKQAQEIAPYVKHVHISDNFGLADTELPAGMGNSPIGKQLELIEKYNKQVKKIVETGSWYSALQLRNTPIVESLSAMGSPVYSMRMSPYWNQTSSTFGGYFSGVGPTNTDIHHQLYGAGFSNLPVELGGQMAGRSRAGGTPFE